MIILPISVHAMYVGDTKPNLFTNPGFESSDTSLAGWTATMTNGSATRAVTEMTVVKAASDPSLNGFNGNLCKVKVDKRGDRWWAYSIGQEISIDPSKTYTFSFKGFSEAPRFVDLTFQSNAYAATAVIKHSIYMEGGIKNYSFTFSFNNYNYPEAAGTVSTDAIPVKITLGNSTADLGKEDADTPDSGTTGYNAAQPTFYFDDVVLKEDPRYPVTANLLKNSEMNDANYGSTWTATGGAAIRLTTVWTGSNMVPPSQMNFNGSFGMQVALNSAPGKWTTNIKQTGITAIKAGKYRLSFSAALKNKASGNIGFNLSDGSTTVIEDMNVPITSKMQNVVQEITIPNDFSAAGTLYFFFDQLSSGDVIVMDSIYLIPIVEGFEIVSAVPTVNSFVEADRKAFSIKFDSKIDPGSIKDGAVEFNGVPLPFYQLYIDSADKSVLNITLVGGQSLLLGQMNSFTFPGLESINGYTCESSAGYKVNAASLISSMSAVFTNGSSQTITALENGNIGIKLSAETTAQVSLDIIAALYNRTSGKMTLISSDKKTLSLNGSGFSDLSLNVPSSSNHEIRVYSWLSFEGMLSTHEYFSLKGSNIIEKPMALFDGITAEYNWEEGVINAKGKILPNKSISIAVCKSGQTLSYENAVFFTEVLSNSEGRFTTAFDLTTASGNYDIYFMHQELADPIKISDLRYVNKSESVTALSEINSSSVTTGAQLFAALTKWQEVLGIDFSGDYETPGLNLTKVHNLILSLKPQGGFVDSAGINLAIKKASALVIISDETQLSNIEGLLLKYEALLSLDLAQLKASDLDPTVKNSILTRILNADFTNPTEINSLINSNIAIESIRITDNWQHVKLILETIPEMVDRMKPGTSFSLVKDPSVVFKRFVLGNYTNLQAMLTAFDTYVADAVKGQGNSGGNPYMGGSSGGGGGGSAVIPSKGLAGGLSDESSFKEVDFSDISDVPWARESILDLAGRGAINGMTADTFSPNTPVTREQFVKILVLALGLEGLAADIAFTDLEKESWSYPYISSAVYAGIVKGNTDNTFGGGSYVTRQDVAVMAYRAITYLELPLNENVSSGIAFIDYELISEYAKNAVTLMQKAGIINGMEDGSFRPADTCTRAQAAKIIYEISK